MARAAAVGLGVWASWSREERPRWRQDGKELYFLSADQQVMAVPVKSGPGLDFGSPATLFRLTRPAGLMGAFNTGYDVSADGQLFLILTRRADPAGYVVAVNWR